MREPEWQPSSIAGSRQAAVERLLQASGQQHYLWGNTAAHDIIKLKDHEGVQGESQVLNLLFPGSGDLRNAILAIAELPPDFIGTCNVVLNDRDMMVVARNAIGLMTALTYDTNIAVPMIIQLWYSRFLTSDISKKLVSLMSPITDLVKKCRHMDSSTVRSLSWTVGDSRLELTLGLEMWRDLPAYFKGWSGLDHATVAAVYQVLLRSPERTEAEHIYLQRQPPNWRPARDKFRSQGVLFPFGDSHANHTIPNP